jgi:hypothetical protein
VLRALYPKRTVNACRKAFWPILLEYLQDHRHEPNHGPHRHYLPMPFHGPCFAPEFFFDKLILEVIRGAREAAMRSVESGECDVHPVLLELGDVLVRHPWAHCIAAHPT